MGKHGFGRILIVAAGLGGCVTPVSAPSPATAPAPSAEPSALSSAPNAALLAAPDTLPSAVVAAPTSAALAAPAAPTAAAPSALPPAPLAHGPVLVTPVPPTHAALPWQRLLDTDAAALEAKGNAFLEASFDLYDQLLEEKAATPERSLKVNAAVKRSADRFRELELAVTRLRADLDRPDVKAALPVDDDAGQRDLATMATLFPAYQPRPVGPLLYDLATGASITALLFSDREHDQAAGLDGLPKPQRDALLLLDYLRDVSNDMAFMSHAVSDWAGTARGVGGDAELVAH